MSVKLSKNKYQQFVLKYFLNCVLKIEISSRIYTNFCGIVETLNTNKKDEEFVSY